MKTPSHLAPRRETYAPVRIDPQRIDGVTTLVVGPNHESTRLTLRLLAGAGVKTIENHPAYDTAPDKIASMRPRLVLLDWTPAPALAAALMSRIRRNGFPLNEVPVVAIVPSLTASTAHAVMRTGVNAMVMRPLSPAALYQRIEIAIHAPRPFVKTRRYFGPSRSRPDPAAAQNAGEGSAERSASSAAILGMSLDVDPSGLVIADRVLCPDASVS
jgi:CheY-like chemotaxis protein